MSFHLGQHTYQFRFRWSFFLLSLFFFILLCSLGIWQLYRYQFKKTLLTNYQANMRSAPQPFLSVAQSGQDQPFQHVAIKGQFDNAHTMLIQNQLHAGREGYEVLTPMRMLGAKKQILIDRGWIAKEKLATLPQANSMAIEGYIKLLNEHQFMLGKNIYFTQFPLVMQKIDIQEIERVTGESFFPFIVRLTSSESDGLIRDWIVTSILPAKHLGYSIQWFLMAAMVMIAFFCFCCEPLTHDH